MFRSRYSLHRGHFHTGLQGCPLRSLPSAIFAGSTKDVRRGRQHCQRLPSVSEEGCRYLHARYVGLYHMHPALYSLLQFSLAFLQISFWSHVRQKRTQKGPVILSPSLRLYSDEGKVVASVSKLFFVVVAVVSSCQQNVV